ncbi:MAG: hypothetical protein NDI82_03290 [Anaeromyxobacteraceae bacterium]|nr:hypothetical protein [Anaeromyxobacteraceae bacterium]
MRTFPDLRFRELLSLLTEAKNGLAEDGPGPTLDRVVVLRERAAALGVRSPHVAWMEATALELLDRHEEAYRAAVEAARLDPLSVTIQEQFARLAWARRHALAEPSRDPLDESTPRLYALLQETGESDVPCHLAMARHLEATGLGAEAARLVEAVLLVAPASKEAWLERSRLARASGDGAIVARCTEALERIRARSVPFDLQLPAA